MMVDSAAMRQLVNGLTVALVVNVAACGDSAGGSKGSGAGGSGQGGAAQGGSGAGGSAGEANLAAVPSQSVERASMHAARAGHTATLLPDGRVVVMGGEVLPSREMIETVEAYDPQVDSWTELAPLPESRCNHTATLLDDGTILVVGGGQSNAIGLPSGLQVRTEALIYDPTTDSYESLGPNLVPRHGHHAVGLPSGEVLLVGGADDESTVKPSQGNSNPQPFGNALASAEIYDPDTKTFHEAGSLAEARYAFGLAPLADGRVLVSGGSSYDSMALSLVTAEIFDEESGSFTSGGAFDGLDRLFHSQVALADGRVFVFGGKQSNVAFLDDTQIFDATSSTWVAGAPLPPARTATVSVPTAEGGALVVGGLACTFAGCQTPPQVDLWHPDGTATTGPALHQGRASGTATVLQDGTVLVVGGYGAIASLASVELLVP
jgi:N-acetylneuraminic acid mutarotase